MERVKRNAIIGMGVRPRVRCGGIKQRQKLDYAHAGNRGIIDETVQIAEIAYAKRLLGTQGEQRNDYSGGLPRAFSHSQILAAEHQYLPVAKLSTVGMAVIALLPSYYFVLTLVDNNILIFNNFPDIVDIQRESPLILSRRIHLQKHHWIP